MTDRARISTFSPVLPEPPVVDPRDAVIGELEALLGKLRAPVAVESTPERSRIGEFVRLQEAGELPPPSDGPDRSMIEAWIEHRCRLREWSTVERCYIEHRYLTKFSRDWLVDVMLNHFGGDISRVPTLDELKGLL